MDTSDTRGSGPSALAGSMLSATVPALADLLVKSPQGITGPTSSSSPRSGP